MEITIQKINPTKKNIKKFLQFKLDLYKGNKYNVPDLVIDDLLTLDPKKNPAYEFCESQCFFAYRGTTIVGRICAIINHKANKTWGHDCGRFGYFDFIDDIEVTKSLLDAAQQWVQERGMVAIQGPFGFTDMDKEGLLVEGFDQLSTLATLYNYPYYSQHLEQLGYTTCAEWVEMLVTPQPVGERVAHIADMAESRGNLKVLKFKSAKQVIKDGWGEKIFDLINRAYAPLYGVSELSNKQIDFYLKMYGPMLNTHLLSLVADQENNLMAFGIVMPSFSKALQKTKGHLSLIGYYHLYKALKAKKSKRCDFMLIGVEPSCHNKGINAVIMREIAQGLMHIGCEICETNPELVTNAKVQSMWNEIQPIIHKRRKSYIKSFQ